MQQQLYSIIKRLQRVTYVDLLRELQIDTEQWQTLNIPLKIAKMEKQGLIFSYKLGQTICFSCSR